MTLVMENTRKFTYGLSVLAVVCFFLFPEPRIAVVGALMLQTLAFIIVAGKSPLDGMLLTGISFVLIGLIPADHPFVAGSESYRNARWALIATGLVMGLGMLAILLYRTRK